MAILESPSACIAAEEGVIAKAVLMPGDPLRAKFVAEHYQIGRASCRERV